MYLDLIPYFKAICKPSVFYLAKSMYSKMLQIFDDQTPERIITMSYCNLQLNVVRKYMNCPIQICGLKLKA